MATFDLNKASFTWTYTPGAVVATGLRLKVGTASGVYTISKDFPATSGTAAVNSVIDAPGNYFAKLVAFNATGEGVGSTELPFALSAVPNGSVTLAVG